MLATGGYPELQGRSARGRSRFFASYVASIIGRDLDDIANVRNVENVERLLFMIAARSGGIASFHGMADRPRRRPQHGPRPHQGPRRPLSRPPTAALARQPRQPPDQEPQDPRRRQRTAGLPTGANERRIADDGEVAGLLLESFTAIELLRQADWAQEPVQLFHYRDGQQREVDVILERHSGEIIGMEVKAGATPAARDFAGLRYLRDKLGARFKAGVVLHTGADTLPFGDRLAAVPISGLWS